jgi:hypothetical protein
VLDAIRAERGVAAVSTLVRATIDVGEVGVPTFAVEPDGRGPSVELVTLSGRRPLSPGEVELGPATAHDLGVGIGGDVTLAAGRTLRIVGLGLFPSDVHAQFDEGAWVLPEDWTGLAQDQIDAGAAGEIIAVRFADRDHLDAQIDALRGRLGDQVGFVGPVERPDELVNLHHVRSLPAVLATFLALVGLAAVAYSLFSSIRRRRRDFAVMSALGVTRRGARLVVVAQAAVVVVVGILVGVPVGLVAGRSGWRAIAERVPLVFRSPLEPATVALVVLAAVGAALVLAVLPARRAARTRAATVLRAE